MSTLANSGWKKILIVIAFSVNKSFYVPHTELASGKKDKSPGSRFEKLYL